MGKQKRPRLPRGLHWGPKSPFILFNGRDALGKQHHQSTGTNDPQEALLFELKFLANVDQNISGGVRYLAWLVQQFHDFRLVTAAYYAGEDVIGKRGLAYRNLEVSYVKAIRAGYVHEAGLEAGIANPGSKRDVR